MTGKMLFILYIVAVVVYGTAFVVLGSRIPCVDYWTRYCP